MQIHELNTLSGTLGSGNYFATDDGTDTTKVSAQDILDQAASQITKLMYYGTCSTGASTATKVVSCSGFTLFTGAVIAVKFSYAQTSTDNIYMNVNGTGEKRVYGIARTTSATSRLDGAWEANEVKVFAYDGSYWRLIDQNIITNSQLSSLNTLLGVYGLYDVLNKVADFCVNPFEVQTLTYARTMAASGAINIHEDLTKSGYYPVGIVGLSMSGANSGFGVLRSFEISNKAEGSGHLSTYITNRGTGTGDWTITIQVLWKKIL